MKKEVYASPTERDPGVERRYDYGRIALPKGMGLNSTEVRISRVSSNKFVRFNSIGDEFGDDQLAVELIIADPDSITRNEPPRVQSGKKTFPVGACFCLGIQGKLIWNIALNV